MIPPPDRNDRKAIGAGQRRSGGGMTLRSRRGVALTIAIMMIICSSLLAGYALQLGWNQRRLIAAGGSKRDKILWAAKAGVVDARRRIRSGILLNGNGGVPNGPPGSFQNDAYDPGAYNLDIDADATDDVTVDIGPVTAVAQPGCAANTRCISSTGLDV